MIANYHTHTSRCKHAIGTDEEYVQAAISRGVKLLGFSDHAPFLYPNNYSSFYKMEPYEISDYFDSLISLREKYKNKIEIHIGFEAEYYENIFPESLSLWRNYPVEYLILGHHILYNEYVEKPIGAIGYTESDDRLFEYTDKVVKGLLTGRFSIFAHPDIINYHGNEDTYLSAMEKIILTAKKMEVPLEYNILGMRAKRNYPDDRFWRLASELDATAIIGSDAHDPRDLALPEENERALSYLKSLGIRTVDFAELRNPLFFKD